MVLFKSRPEHSIPHNIEMWGAGGVLISKPTAATFVVAVNRVDVVDLVVDLVDVDLDVDLVDADLVDVDHHLTRI